ncbi:MAG: adenosylcobinamide-GDP ribazoletransferase [Anaerolineales bacterium]|nr:adenosylcobinamide-GDP ribazoletransferase [Chloroflexota bacterium]MBL6982918.1 adenosylcobinamide-GDP ribazoletransferase [Anaerolineales bacterium]
MIPFLAALQFLTLSPPLVKRAFTEKELGQAAGFYPLIGALIGALLYGANYGLALIVPNTLRAALVLGLWVALSGALHLDGLLDAFDGILGGFTLEKRLEIMRDERVGAFGLSAGVILLLVKYSSLSGFPQSAPVLILIPVLSRGGMTLAVFAFPYARPAGLGSAVKAHITWKQVTLATLTALLAAWICASWIGLLAVAITMLLVWGISIFVLRRIPGLTGDIYGTINEIAEMFLLVIFAAIYFA